MPYLHLTQRNEMCAIGPQFSRRRRMIWKWGRRLYQADLGTHICGMFQTETAGGQCWKQKWMGPLPHADRALSVTKSLNEVRGAPWLCIGTVCFRVLFRPPGVGGAPLKPGGHLLYSAHRFKGQSHPETRSQSHPEDR